METSLYQQAKLHIGQFVPFDRDFWHVLLGFVIILSFAMVDRWRRTRACWGVMLVGTAMLAIGMEALDLRDDIASLGFFRWGESVMDVLLTIAVPAVATMLWLPRNKSGKVDHQ